MRRSIAGPLAALAVAGIGAGGYLWASSGGGEEDVPLVQATATQSASATATPSVPTTTAIPSPSGSPQPTSPVEIPADWQTYDDPKGRFSIRVPPDWEYSRYSSEDNPSWLRRGPTQKTNGHITDGVKLSVIVEMKLAGETLEDQPDDNPEAPILTREAISVNGRSGLRVTRGFDAANPSQVTYFFDRGAEWLLVNVFVRGPDASRDLLIFDQIIKSFLFA